MVDDAKIKIPTIKSAALFDGAQANTLLEGILRKICDKNKKTQSAFLFRKTN